MDWGDLPFFLAVARRGQLSQAAMAMHADPTTVGRRVRRLERALGVRLFEQAADGQTLTPAGERLLKRVEAMAALANEAATVPLGGNDVTGTVRISVAEGFGTWFVARHLSRFADTNPALEIDLVANSGFLNPTRRETDLAVLLAPPRRGPLITRKLTDYRLNLYASKEYLSLHPPIDSPEALRDHRLIGYVPDIIYAPELRYLDELPLKVGAQLRSSSINAQHGLIASGAGLGVLPCFIGGGDPGLSRVLPDIQITRSFWLTTHRETRNFPQVRAMSDWLVDLVRRHRPLFLGEAG